MSNRKPTLNVLALLAFIIALVALFFPRPTSTPQFIGESSSALAQVRASRTLRIGFEGYPPYAVQDPNDLSMSGYSVDLVHELASRAGWDVQWVKTSPDTKIPDLKAGRFDVMVEPIFQTVARAKEVAFTEPYAYFGYASGIVRRGDTRFHDFLDLNNEEITVVVRQGYTDEPYAKRHLPNATVRSMKVDDTSLAFLEVTSGKADIALADSAEVIAFAEQHQGSVDTRFVEPPPAFVPAGFMLRQKDLDLVLFFNTALRSLETDGVLDTLDARYPVVAFRERRLFK